MRNVKINRLSGNPRSSLSSRIFQAYLKLISLTILRRIITIIRESGLFDLELYKRSNPEVANLNLDPIVHYLFYGRFQGRNPGHQFFTGFYINTDPLSEKKGAGRFLQWLLNASKEFQTKPFCEIIQEFETEDLPHRVCLQHRGVDGNISPNTPSETGGVYEKEDHSEIPSSLLKLIAFYLPQFHPFEENDRFWGKGFTEWHNVTRALPLFQGHYQPKLPGELGFYDIRLKNVMKRQIELARQHGISGFCFHHYFLDGKPVMRVPFDQMMCNKELDMPFCLHWANEPWTVRWDGNRNRDGVLLDQRHDEEENMAFIQDITPALKDSRYIHIDGRPLLLIYRPGLFPDARKTVDTWKKYCHENGIGDLYLVMVLTLFDKVRNPEYYGFDAAVEFPPHLTPRISVRNGVSLYDDEFNGYIYSYKEVMDESLKLGKPDYTLFRGLMPQWDNTARNQAATVYYGSTPELYRKWLTELGHYTLKNLPANKRIIFINAWNEWAEGAYLEPDLKFGYAYLNATAKALWDIWQIRL